MAAGFGLVLVGAVGTSGINFSGLSGAGLSAGQSQNPVDNREGQEITSSPQGFVTDAAGSDDRALGTSAAEGPYQPTSRSNEETSQSERAAIGAEGYSDGDNASSGLFSPTDGRLPWLVVLGLGVGLLAAGIYLRFSLQPRAR